MTVSYIDALLHMKNGFFYLDLLTQEEINVFLPTGISIDFSEVDGRKVVYVCFDGEIIFTWTNESEHLKRCSSNYIKDIELQEKLAELVYDIAIYSHEKHKAQQEKFKEQKENKRVNVENKLRDILLN